MMGNVVSNRIRNARKALGISQVELAKSCDVTSQTVYKYEAGRVENIPLNTLERFAAVLGVSPAYLAGWTDATSGASKMDVQVKSPTLLCAACPICGSVKFGPKHDNVVRSGGVLLRLWNLLPSRHGAVSTEDRSHWFVAAGVTGSFEKRKEKKMTITRNIQIPDTKNTITVEIELSCSELETAYREQERYYRLMDAEGQLCTYLGFDVSDFDPDNEDDAEKLESFKEKFGDTEPISLVDEESPNYVLNDIVAQFEHDADCNNDVNSTWQNAVEEVLNILQARLCYEAVSGGDEA